MKRTEAPALPDFEIKTDGYSLCSIGGILHRECFQNRSTNSLMYFLDDVCGDSWFKALEKVVENMEIQGVKIPDITARCVWELEMEGSLHPHMIMYATDRFFSIRFENDITYEPKFGISKGVFRHLIRAGREMTPRELFQPMCAELATKLARSTTAKDIVDVFRFRTLAYNSPMLKYLLSREMTNHGKI